MSTIFIITVFLPVLALTQMYHPHGSNFKIPSVTIFAHDPNYPPSQSPSQSLSQQASFATNPAVCCPCSSCCSCSNDQHDEDSDKVPSFTHELVVPSPQTELKPNTKPLSHIFGGMNSMNRPIRPSSHSIFGGNRFRLKNRNRYPVPPGYFKDPLNYSRQLDNHTDLSL